MSMVIRCEHCQKPLKLPEEYVGKEVRCPACQREFVARQELEAPPPRREPPASEPERREADTYPPRDEERPSRRRRYDDDDDRGANYDDYRPRRRGRFYDERRYREAHRGGSILAMGIISMVTFCFPILSVSLALGAIVMANTDNAKMRRGEMDPSGQGQTTAGMVCGIFGLVISVLAVGCICLGNLGGNH